MAEKETRVVRQQAGKKGTKHDETVNMVSGLHQLSENWYNTVRATWANNYRYWLSTQKADFFSKKELPVGLAWLVTDGVISAMTHGRPKPVFLPDDSSDKKEAEAIARIISGPVWEMLKSEETNEQVIKYAMAMAGACVTKIGVDERRRLYDTAIDPYHCFPEQNVNSLEDMEYFETRVPVAVGKLRFAFGSEANHVKAETIDDDRSMYLGGAQPGYTWNTNNTMNVWGNEDGEFAQRMGERHGRAMLTHIWLRDYEIGEIPFEQAEVDEEHSKAGTYDIGVHDWENHVLHVEKHIAYVRELQAKWDLAQLSGPAGLPILDQAFEVIAPEMEADARKIGALIEHIKEHKNYPMADKGLKYPHGREIWICQDKVLLDRASAFGNPYHAFQFDRDIGGNFWGKSLMAYMAPLQEAFNKLITKVDKHADIVANGRFFFNSRSKIMWDKLKRALTGQRAVAMGIPVNGNPRENIYWDYGGTMPAHVFQLLGMLERLAYSIGGYTEVMQGQVPDYSSGAAIGKAIQSAGVRIRKGVKHLGWFYRDKYRDYVKYLKHTDPLQVFKYYGKDDEMVYHAFMNIDWDAMSDVRIDVRNVLGTYREEQFAKLQGILEKNPNLANILLPAMAEFIDVPIDTDQLNKEQDLQNALSVMHDQVGQMRAEMKSEKQG